MTWRSFLGLRLLSEQEAILALVHRVTTHETLGALLIFQTAKQRTWLVCTTSEVVCVLDDLRRTEPDVKWRMSHEQIIENGRLKIRITEEPFSNRSGRLNIGSAHRGWLFSRDLFEPDGSAADRVREWMVSQLIPAGTASVSADRDDLLSQVATARRTEPTEPSVRRNDLRSPASHTGFEHKGLWWDPHYPNTTWPGTLMFDPIAGATLSLALPFDPGRVLDEAREFGVIHGRTNGGLEITLIDCFERSRTDIFANAVITGFLADGPDPQVRVAAAVIENLSEWWGKNALEHERELKFPNMGVRYIEPEATEVYSDHLMRLSIRSSPLASFRRDAVSMREEIRIELTASEQQPLSTFRRRIHACQDLLSVASLTLCNVTEFRISPPSNGGRPTTIGHVYAVPVFKTPSEGWPRFLFQYTDIAPRATDVFTRWIENAESLSVVRSLYMSSAYGKAFLEIKLLALAQAAEAYHRRAYENHDLYMAADDYEYNVLPGLVAAIPKGLDPSHRQALNSRLKFGNEFSFRKRLTMLFDEHEAAMAVIFPSSRTWIERIVSYRNDLTHHPVVEDRPAVDRLALIQCNYVLRILLELCFLKSMGLDNEKIKTLAERCSMYQQIRRRFFADA